jgi:hypothetical protein
MRRDALLLAKPWEWPSQQFHCKKLRKIGDHGTSERNQELGPDVALVMHNPG